ncbi:SPOR domain-containing protein [Parvularcula sp. LCG005]|uniref:SPOR domain-containing protein n=1 Tax=Parvularcula sp. LCG005 TaxID=3078805 RepID=UPI002943AFA3|nr:SPOR domain-containing protein [Parvularcula sp. LCG005]WOI54150.1 SPOR domain-containing protein [Parvularcula sp. LCG005]
MKESLVNCNALMALTGLVGLAACATAEAPVVQPPERAVSQPKLLPAALMRPAYDAPEIGDNATFRPRPVATPQPVEQQAVAPSAVDRLPVVAREQQSSAYNAPEMSAETHLAPKEPQELAFTDEDMAMFDVDEEPASVPAAPPVRAASWDSAADLDAFDPIPVTDSRSPRAKPVAETPQPSRDLRGAKANPPTGASSPQPQPQRLASAGSNFAGQLNSVMPMVEEIAPPPPRSATGGYGVHLASYRDVENVVTGWHILQDRHSDVLSVYKAKGDAVTIPGQGDFIRLLVGPFETTDDALQLCDRLESRDEYCKVMPFKGTPVL